MALVPRPLAGVAVRVRERITPHFRIPPAPHLWLVLNREILNVAQATPTVSLNRPSQIYGTGGREFYGPFLSRTLRPEISRLRLFSGGFGPISPRR